MEESHNKLYFIKNTSGISLVEFGWGLGLPLVLESTFLQLFLSKLGATNLLIGFVPTLFYIGQALLGITAAYYTRNLERKRPFVIITHIIPALIILGFGIYLRLSGTFNSSTIFVFFPAYLMFNAGIGLLVPVWQNYLVKIFDGRNVIQALSIMMIFQSAARLISSFLITGYFMSREITAQSSSLLFIFCGIVFFAGSFGFLLTGENETAGTAEKNRLGFLSFTLDAFKKITGNKNILLFILSDIDMYAVIAVISFYANFAVDCHGVSSAAAAGLFVGMIYLGQIAANFFFGTLNLFALKNKTIIARICSITGILIIASASGLYFFLGASVLLGISRAVRSLVYAPAVKTLSGKEDITDIFGAAPIMMLPLSVGISLLSGKFLDIVPIAPLAAHRILFLILGSLSLLSIFFVGRINFSGKSA